MKHYYQNVNGWFSFNELYSEMVRKFPDNSHFVEIGSWQGKSSVYMGVEIINSNKKIQFDCIDNWSDGVMNGVVKDTNGVYEEAYQQFLINIKPISSVVNVYKLPSEEASKLYEDNSLDFVFIDASHDYDNVLNDMSLWYSKVKDGGVFAGHDYTDNWPEVKRAVDEFFKDKEFQKKQGCWVYYK